MRLKLQLLKEDNTKLEKKNIAVPINPLLADICQQKRLIINGVSIRIKLFPQRNAFMLLTNTKDGEKLKINLIEAQLFVCKVTLHPSVILAHENSLNEEHNILYPYTKGDLRLFTIPKGQLSETFDNPFCSEIPNVLYIVLVSENAHSGHYEKSPFKFNHYFTDFINVTVDGIPLPIQSLSPNFDQNLYIDSYRALKNAILFNEKGKPGVINRKMFKDGYTIFAFDLGTKVEKNSFLFNPKRKGQLRINIKFSKPLPEGVNVILYGKFPDLIQIDQTRNIIKA